MPYKILLCLISSDFIFGGHSNPLMSLSFSTHLSQWTFWRFLRDENDTPWGFFRWGLKRSPTQDHLVSKYVHMPKVWTRDQPEFRAVMKQSILQWDQLGVSFSSLRNKKQGHGPWPWLPYILKNSPFVSKNYTFFTFDHPKILITLPYKMKILGS